MIILPGGPEGPVGPAVPVSLAFLLIVPLQIHAVWRSYQLSNAVAEQQQARTIKQATEKEELQRRLLALQRPDLRIGLDPSRFPTIPLPALKWQLLSQLDQAEGQVKGRFAPIDPATADRITLESLRVMVSSTSLAAGFADYTQPKNQLGPSWSSGRPCWIARPGGGQSCAAIPFQKSAAKRAEEFCPSLAPPEEDPCPGPKSFAMQPRRIAAVFAQFGRVDTGR
ncbi:hypothetical protein KQ305_06660 [Synechococcus sp. CS-1332]|nr:hypothetical protein [Synechococcus sp. CS-1332]